MPVSIDPFGSGVSVPSSERSNCMNTRFQISRLSGWSALTRSAVFAAGSSPM
jgi:hypothetical protein